MKPPFLLGDTPFSRAAGPIRGADDGIRDGAGGERLSIVGRAVRLRGLRRVEIGAVGQGFVVLRAGESGGRGVLDVLHRRAVREGTNRLSIQLSPAELGKIHVKLEIDEEKRVTAALTVEKPSTLELLQRDMKGLERALQEAGLKMDGSDLSFNLGRQDGNEFSQEMRQSGTAGFGSGSSETQAEGALLADQAAAQVDTAAGLVNVQI